MALVDKNGNKISGQKWYSATDAQVQAAIDARIADGTLKIDLSDEQKQKLSLFTLVRKNLIDPKAITKGGYYVWNTGAWATSGAHSTSDFIPCEYGKSYIFRNYGSGGGTQVTFWDADKNYVSGQNGATVIVPPSANCAYMRFSIYTASANYWYVAEGTTAPDKQADYVLVELEKMNTAISEIVSEKENKKMEIVNVTVAGQTQMTHPSIVYFAAPWNGYSYWMAVTPYPNNNDTYENPSIICSNDAINWEEPSGITNPITPKASDNSYYNSDCELVYRTDTDTLECWYRRANRSPVKETIIRKTSKDGITWGEEEILFESNTGASVLSPCVIFRDGRYMIWVNNNTQKKIEYYETNDGTGWQFIRDIVITGVPEQALHPWHMCVKYNQYENCYDMYFVVGKSAYSWRPDTIYYTRSTDNTTYTLPIQVITSTPYSYEDQLYRPTFCDTVQTGFSCKRIIVYGCMTNDSKWYINMAYSNTHSGHSWVKFDA